MKTIASSIFLGLAMIVIAYFVFVVAAVIVDNFRVRAAQPVKFHPIFFVPDFMGFEGFMTTGRAFLTGTLGLGLLLLAISMHLKWTAMKTEPQIDKGTVELDVAPNHSLPPTQKSMSSVRASEEI
jgi:hypothetical protein